MFCVRVAACICFVLSGTNVKGTKYGSVLLNCPEIRTFFHVLKLTFIYLHFARK
ncbi:hypothetical protein HMPREF1141_3428 [Clostridium sp. MSTE9]|nr:hypothetical protein HMPREF1141_3428 [Clostridium sp. MSTE9]